MGQWLCECPLSTCPYVYVQVGLCVACIGKRTRWGTIKYIPPRIRRADSQPQRGKGGRGRNRPGPNGSLAQPLPEPMRGEGRRGLKIAAHAATDSRWLAE